MPRLRQDRRPRKDVSSEGLSQLASAVQASRLRFANMGESARAGWYPDPNDGTAEIYWDGVCWHGRRQKFLTPPQVPQAQVTDDQNSTTRVLVLVVGVIVGVIVMGALLWSCANAVSPYDKECRRDLMIRTGKQGKELDDLVKICVDLKEKGYK